MSKTYSASKSALDQGVPGLRILFENGKVRIPWAPESRETVALWISELASFGWAAGKLQGVGAHDDTVMAFWMADRAILVGESISLVGDLGGDEIYDTAGSPFDMGSDDAPDYFGMGGPRLPGLP